MTRQDSKDTQVVLHQPKKVKLRRERPQIADVIEQYKPAPLLMQDALLQSVKSEQDATVDMDMLLGQMEAALQDQRPYGPPTQAQTLGQAYYTRDSLVTIELNASIMDYHTRQPHKKRKTQ